MKKVFFILFPLLINAISVSAQSSPPAQYSGLGYTGLGLRGGFNLTQLSETQELKQGINSTEDMSLLKAGFHVGLYVKWKLSNSIMLQPELLYSTKGSKSKFTNPPDFVTSHGTIFQREKVTLSYVDLPIFLRYNMSRGLHFLAGPQASFLLNGLYKYVNKGVRKNQYEPFRNANRLDVGVAAGFGYEMKNGLNFGMRASFGFISTVKNTNVKNTVIQLTVGRTLSGRKGKKSVDL